MIDMVVIAPFDQQRAAWHGDRYNPFGAAGARGRNSQRRRQQNRKPWSDRRRVPTCGW